MIPNTKDIDNSWKLILTQEQIVQTVKKCADFLNAKFEKDKVVVACILKGAAYFHVDLTRMLNFPHSSYFIEASSYNNSQTQSEDLEILSIINPDKFQGKKVILLDELYDNGITLNRVKERIAEKAQIPITDIFTCVAFRKNKEAVESPPDLCGISLPDVWLVGYGLDDRQEKRNWTQLYGCPKIEGIPKTPDDAIFEDEKYYQTVLDCLKSNNNKQ